MMHRLWLLSLGCCLILQGQARADPPVAPETDVQGITEKLDMFVSRAIVEGLLMPVSTEIESSDSEVSARSSGLEQPGSHSALDCELPYSLDFQELAQLTQYQEIYALREQLNEPSGRVDARANWNLAKAYLALGLNSEALMLLRDASEPEPVAYQKLAGLMENNQQPDVAYFRELASCHQPAGIWLALALLADGQDGGARLLEEHMTEFRQLPLQLRINIAAISAPALEHQKERILGQKLLADFSESELRDSSQLRFSAALLDLESNSLEAEQDVQLFLNQPQFQEAALSLMLRNHRSVGSAYKDVLVDDLVRKIERAGSEREIAASLSYALRELSTDSHYIRIMQLADLPILNRLSAQEEIAHYLIVGLRRDLGSEDPMRNLLAINALVNEAGLLDSHPDRNNLYAQAIKLAFDFGFKLVGEELAHKTDTEEAALLQRVRLAFRRGDHSSVYRVAQDHPDNQPINLLAALSAIKQQDTQKLNVFEARLDPQPGAILALLEQDAASEQWMVSERVYLAAEGLTGDEQSLRVKRVMNLKQLGRAIAPSQPTYTMANLPEMLARTGSSLASKTRETR